MVRNRGPKPLGAEKLANGPGKLCRALDIDLGFYGYDLSAGEELWMADDGLRVEVASSARINIDYAGQYRDLPWRFFIEGSRFLSR
jgi:DNA-3-methyladenine glycosylase